MTTNTKEPTIVLFKRCYDLEDYLKSVIFKAKENPKVCKNVDCCVPAELILESTKGKE